MKKSFKLNSLLAALMCGSLLSACSDSGVDANAVNGATQTPAQGASQSAAETREEAKPEASGPERAALADAASYRPLTGTDLAFARQALSEGEPDRHALAKVLSERYLVEFDSFKRRDLITQLTPKMDEAMHAVKTNPHYVLDMVMMMGAYDLDTKGFQTDIGSSDDRSLAMSSPGGQYNLIIQNARAFETFVVDDEALARSVEQVRAANFGSFKARLFLTLEGVGRGESDVIGSIAKIQILDNAGGVLAEF